MLQLQKQSNSEIFFIIVDGFAAVGEELEDVIGLFQFKDVPPIDANLQAQINEMLNKQSNSKKKKKKKKVHDFDWMTGQMQ